MRKMIKIALWLGLALTITGCMNASFYHPTSKVYRLPSADGYKYEDIVFSSKDGTQLAGIFIPATTRKTKGTVIHFHGNAQNMTAHYSFVKWLPKAGFNLFMFDYRGYGRSGGHPGRKGIHHDSLAAMRYIRARRDLDPDRLLVLGQSLGGALAIAALGDGGSEGVRAMVLDSALYSYTHIAKQHLKRFSMGWLARPFLPFLITNGYAPSKYLKNIGPIPKLFIHGKADRVVPYENSERLNREATEPKRLILIENGRHTDALGRKRKHYVPIIQSFFEDALE